MKIASRAKIFIAF